MPTATATPTVPPPRPPKRFSVADYHRMMELGLITKSDRCELIRGLIVEKPRVNPPHAAAVRRITRLLSAVLTERTVLQIQLPITLSDSEPEPDAAVLRGDEADYDHRHPGPRDVLLVVEVSDSSLDDDSTTKLSLYAGEKLTEYWIVNVVDRVVQVYTNPRGGRTPTYRTRTDYAGGESVPVSFGKVMAGTIPAEDLLG
jgi:Uma2 family endonuclease